MNRGFLSGSGLSNLRFWYGNRRFLPDAAAKELAAVVFGSMFLTSALEWITGYVLKRCFTQPVGLFNQPFNLSGYICLRFSILWGLGCVMVMDLIHPGITRFVRWIPTLAGQIIVGICLFCFACDFYVTVAGILKLNRRLKRLEEVSGLMHELSEDIGSGLAEGALKLAGTGEKLKESSAQWKEEAEQKRAAFRGTIEARQEPVSLDGRAEKAGFFGVYRGEEGAPCPVV